LQYALFSSLVVFRAIPGSFTQCLRYSKTSFTKGEILGGALNCFCKGGEIFAKRYEVRSIVTRTIFTAIVFLQAVSSGNGSNFIKKSFNNEKNIQSDLG